MSNAIVGYSGETQRYLESPSCKEHLVPFVKLITARHAARGGITEIRILGGPGGRRSTFSGYFDHEHYKDLIRNILPKASSPRPKIPYGDHPRIGEGNIYFSLRPCHPDLLARSANTVTWAEQTTSDQDILCYDMFAVDVDPERKSQISASDEEKHNALLVAQEIKKWFLEKGIKSIWADSGNGYHLLIPTLPYSGDHFARAVEDSKLLLHYLAEEFNTGQAKVDTTIFNPARILRLYGTLTMKGSNLAGKRPHRWSTIDLAEIPLDIDLFGHLRETIDEYKREIQERQKPTAVHTAPSPSNGPQGSSGKPSWTRETCIQVLEGILTLSYLEFRKDEKSGRMLFIFKKCPYHTDDDGHIFECCVMVEPDGRFSASCKHDSNAHWKDFKAVIGWEQHREGVLKSLGLWRGKSPRPASQSTDAKGGSTDSSDLSRFFTKKGNFLPNVLAMEIQESHTFLTSPIDEAGKGVKLLVYKDGVFQSGESLARTVAHTTLEHLSTPSRIDATAALIKENTKVPANHLNPRALDLINIENGMLEWSTGKLLEHSADYRSTFRIRAAFDPQTQCPIIDRFLSEVFPQDALALAEEMMGYLLIPTTRYQAAFMLLGPGANGKSTFLAAVEALLGEENVSHVALQELSDNRFAVAELLNRLANIYPDLPSKAVEQSDIFKAIVSGDVIKAERKFQHPFDLRTSARLLFSANELPPSKDHTHAYFRRWRIIPFINRFEGKKADKDLVDKLTTPEARSTLLNRAVQGLRRLQAQRGFTDCPSVLLATEKYRKQCDNVYDFAQELLEVSQGGVLVKEDVYKAYKDWCEEAGIPHPVSQKSFNKRLIEVWGIVEGRETMPDGKKHRVWLGLGWKADAEGNSPSKDVADQSGPGRPGFPYFPLPANSVPVHGNNGKNGEEGQNGEKLAEPGLPGPSRSNGLDLLEGSI